jgi:phosphoenolpyruvate-protein phosphotransferase
MSRTDLGIPLPSGLLPAQRPEQRFAGLPIGPGIAIGPVFGTTEAPLEIPRHRIAAADIEAEGARLDAAIASSRKQLSKLRARLHALPEDSQAELAPLLDAYALMLGPSRLVRGARRRIAQTLRSAEQAVHDEAEAIAAALAAAGDDDPASAERRAEEVREIGRRLVRNLTRAPYRSFAGLPAGSVLFAESLQPADAALIDPARIAGVATEEGGLDGHTAIMLRALGIPTVLGAPGLGAAMRAGDLMVVDGNSGIVVLNPDAATQLQARRDAMAFARRRQRWARVRRLPAQTRDGTPVELQGNLELPAELPLIAQAGAAGIGLLRSEFLFMNRDTLPSETEQAEIYAACIEAMAGDPVTIRVLDWGGEKEIEALSLAGLAAKTAEVNPALGLRGIRMLLRHPSLLETQFCAILRASLLGPVRVLLPMVTNGAEIRAARTVYLQAAETVRHRGARLPDPLPPLGVMVEVPAAALTAASLAEEAEFFAIGTNDLSMYALATDRAESDPAHLYDPLHPAVLRLIQMTAEAGRQAGIPVSVCGEVAGNALATPLLLGLGLRSFSMSAANLPRVKQAVRNAGLAECRLLADEVLATSDLARTGRLLRRFAALPT